MELDVRSFWALLASSERVRSAQIIEMAWTMMIAAQGKTKGMKGWLKPHTDRVGGSAGEEEFLAKFGQGF